MNQHVWVRVCAFIGAAGLSVSLASADNLQNQAVRARQSELVSGNLGGMTGAGVKIGVIEAGNNIPNYAGLLTPGSSLPNGNPFLPAARFTAIPQGGVFGAADTPGNHASTVAGVIGSSNAFEPGIATGAHMIVAGTSSTSDSIKNTEDAVKGGAKIINYSWGIRQGLGNNNGTSPISLWVDYAARTDFISPIEDVLFIIAGNETPDGTNDYGAPSDAYNCINVGATGVIAGDGTLNYRKQSAYNRTNTTANPGGGRGRIKTDIVAPGGDPGAATADGTVAQIGGALNPVSQFFGTSGGQITLTGTDGAGRPIYQGDDWSGGGLNNDSFRVVDTVAPLIGGPFPAMNPGTAEFAGADTFRFTRTAGTSFAAPLVAGAAALLQEKGTATGMSTDHRVLKSVLLNGADKNIIDQDGMPWGRYQILPAPKPDPVHGGNQAVKVGLDPQLGTGMLDVVKTGQNYTAGQRAPGNVPNIGWDLNDVGSLGTQSYFFTDITQLTATLIWDRQTTAHSLLPDGLYDPDHTFFSIVALLDLDLHLYLQLPDGFEVLIDWSTSDIDNVEHIWNVELFQGDYRLEVSNLSGSEEEYALAWFAVPTPGVASIMLVAGIVSFGRRRRD